MGQIDDILTVVQKKGPVVPSQIKKELGLNTITIGAMLSELARTGKILISSAKIGGSPVYYTKEQKEKLEILRQHMNDKQQKAYDRIKEQRILRDVEQEPVIRAAIRDIKDFAKALEVNIPTGTEIFWKWHLITNNDAEQVIRSKLGMNKQEKQEKLQEEKSKIQPKAGGLKNKELKKTEEKKLETQEKEAEKNLSDDPFAQRIQKYFTRKSIQIVEEKIIRKNGEIEYELVVPNAIGAQEYYCRAKNKKKCNDGDLSAAYVQGLIKRLPTLFITTGEITKKAKELLQKDYKGMLVKEL